MRTLWDRNQSLWCGWVVKAPGLNLWFCGDSGYTHSLLEISSRLGPFNLAALPIGAYAPKWFMHSHHMDPDQAVALHKAVGQPLTIPIHWGVFELADESLDEPPKALERAIEAAGLDSSRFHPLKIGRKIELADLPGEYS